MLVRLDGAMGIEAVVGVTLASADPAASAEAYRILADSVAEAAHWSAEADGVSGTRVAGLDVDIVAAQGGPPPGVLAVHLGVSGLLETTRLLQRRATPFVDADLIELAGLRWRLVDLAETSFDPGTSDRADTGDARLDPPPDEDEEEGGPADLDLIGLDHVVVATDDADRAAASYGARLGLDLRLDRSAPQWGMRGLFFRCGDAVIEVVAPVERPERPDTRDAFGGLAWRSADLEATRARLTASDVEVSPIRTGRKSGTRVMTVRDERLITPSLVIGS